MSTCSANILASKVEALGAMATRLRRDVVDMVWAAGSGHLGGSLSAAEIVAALFFSELNVDPARPGWEGRDRFVLSKGHAAPVVYAALAAKGFFPAEELKTLRQLGSRLQGHPDMTKLPGIDMTSGSLGQGLSAGIGMALAARIRKLDYRVYVLLGDGELQEGQVWEAAMSAAKFGIDNLVAICDLNGVQLDGHVKDIMPIEPIKEKWTAFGWETIEIDGHDVAQILSAFERAREIKGRPTVILARTVKGKGVSFMENDHRWHGQPMNREQYERAVAELEARSRQVAREEISGTARASRAQDAGALGR